VHLCTVKAKKYIKYEIKKKRKIPNPKETNTEKPKQPNPTEKLNKLTPKSET
jgi:hypothetical protein